MASPYRRTRMSVPCSGTCFECSYCYSGRGCAVCRVGRGSTQSVRCEKCRRNFCSDHQSLAHDITQVECGSHNHSNIARSCAGCNAASEYIDACEEHVNGVNNRVSFTTEQEAYLEQVYGVDVNFRVFGDDWRNEMTCRMIEYNHAHVRPRNTSMSPPSAPARVRAHPMTRYSATPPTSAPQKRGSDGFASPPAKK